MASVTSTIISQGRPSNSAILSCCKTRTTMCPILCAFSLKANWRDSARSCMDASKAGILKCNPSGNLLVPNERKHVIYAQNKQKNAFIVMIVSVSASVEKADMTVLPSNMTTSCYSNDWSWGWLASKRLTGRGSHWLQETPTQQWDPKHQNVLDILHIIGRKYL